jgi:hypothetical protein
MSNTPWRAILDASGKRQQETGNKKNAHKEKRKDTKNYIEGVWYRAGCQLWVDRCCLKCEEREKM